MKVICNKDKLCDAVTNVSRAVSSKSTILALEGILLQAKGDSLSLTGYDLELGITTTIDAKVESEGEIILSARLLSDMIRRMPYEVIEISSDEKLLTQIVSGAAEYTILGLDPQEFPELPTVSGEPLLEICLLYTSRQAPLWAREPLFAAREPPSSAGGPTSTRGAGGRPRPTPSSGGVTWPTLG